MDDALERRRLAHASRDKDSRGARWLRICAPETIRLKEVYRCGSQLEARMYELWETMRMWREHGAAVRGACYSSITLGLDQQKEMDGLLGMYALTTFAEMRTVCPAYGTQCIFGV